MQLPTYFKSTWNVDVNFPKSFDLHYDGWRLLVKLISCYHLALRIYVLQSVSSY